MQRTLPPLSMNISRMIASASLAAVCLATASPALAATSDEILTQQKEFQAEELCAGRNARDQGRCIGDAIKRMKAMLKDFNDALNEERDAWYKENGAMGATTEYRTALRAYLDEVSAKRKLFRQQQQEIEKSFYSERKTVRQTETKPSTTYSRTITSEDMEAATQKCSKQSDASGLRVCLRLQLRLINPATRQLNITPEGTRVR